MRAAAALGAIVLAAIGALSGCDEDDDRQQRPYSVERDVERARRFDKFELVWLGRKFKGVPLAYVELPRGFRRGERYEDTAAYLTYGREIESNGDSEASGPSLDSIVDIAIDGVQEAKAPPPYRKIGGVYARVTKDRGSGETEVALFGKGIDVIVRGPRRATVLAAARSLRPLNDVPSWAPRFR